MTQRAWVNLDHPQLSVTGGRAVDFFFRPNDPSGHSIFWIQAEELTIVAVRKPDSLSINGNACRRPVRTVKLPNFFVFFQGPKDESSSKFSPFGHDPQPFIRRAEICYRVGHWESYLGTIAFRIVCGN